MQIFLCSGSLRSKENSTFLIVALFSNKYKCKAVHVIYTPWGVLSAFFLTYHLRPAL